MLLKIKLTSKQKSDKSEEKYGFKQKRAMRYPLQKIKTFSQEKPLGSVALKVSSVFEISP